MKENAKEFARLVGAGKIKEAQAMLTGDPLSHEVCHAAMRAALENMNPSGLGFILAFSNDGDRSNYLFHNRWLRDTVGDDGPWVYLKNQNPNPKDPKFLECARMIIQDANLSQNASMRLNDPKGIRPIHAACERGWGDVVEMLLQAGASANGYARNSDSEFSKRKPEWSPMLNALAEGNGSIALALHKSHADHALFPEENWPMRGIQGTREAARRGQIEEGLLGLRVACCGQSPLGLSLRENTHERNSTRPLDSKEDLAIYLFLMAVETDEAIRPKGKSAKKDGEKTEKRSWFSALAGKKALEKSAEESQGAEAKEQEQPPKENGRLDLAIEKLARRDPEGFAWDMPQISAAPEKAALLLRSLASAKMAFWAMPLPGGVGDDGRDLEAWACFKAALRKLTPAEISAPLKEFGGLSVLSIACAMGYEDAAIELASAGASLLPDPLRSPPSAMALAIRFGRPEIASRLLEAGADPMDGIRGGALGLPPRAWPIWEAFEAREGDLIAEMLKANPLARDCPGPNRESLIEQTLRLEREPEREGDEEFAKRIRAGLEAASLISATEPEATPEESDGQALPERVRQRRSQL